LLKQVTSEVATFHQNIKLRCPVLLITGGEKGMNEEKKDVEELKEVLGVVSKEVPALIKGIIGSLFSEESGRDIGKAAAAFYKELKEAGIPEETAVRMTENYVSAFTSLGDLMKKAVSGERRMHGEDIGDEISRKIKEKMGERSQERKEG